MFDRVVDIQKNKRWTFLDGVYMTFSRAVVGRYRGRRATALIERQPSLRQIRLLVEERVAGEMTTESKFSGAGSVAGRTSGSDDCGVARSLSSCAAILRNLMLRFFDDAVFLAWA